ncbi:uncharacterized protein LOC126673998 [Mercurialis annua]|uniref:uncharacterized protein LOC126673998 n=1 Tax=Mercurialis annua TaxID=3986 RepID=UPI00216006B8|nr:uncharacterized protein LOC126673998 [Mercurialis annua]
MKQNPSSSNGLGNLKWWKSLWGLSLPPKIKIFLWRCFNGWLPVREVLMRRGMQIDVRCPLCHCFPESGIHSLWFCKEIRKVWNSWDTTTPLKPGLGWSMADLLIHAFYKLQNEDFLLFCEILWLVWSNRNSKVFGGNCKPVPQLLTWATSYLEEFQQAMASKKVVLNQARQRKAGDRDKRWVPPDPGVYCVNVDASFNSRNGVFGTGFVVRDHTGRVMKAGYKNHGWKASVEVGEACAIREGVLQAIEGNLTPFVIMSDAKVVVDTFNNYRLSCNDVGMIALDCSILLKNVGCLGIRFANRDTNKVAHHLARLASSESYVQYSWRGSVPHEIIPFVLADVQALS